MRNQIDQLQSRLQSFLSTIIFTTTLLVALISAQTFANITDRNTDIQNSNIGHQDQEEQQEKEAQFWPLIRKDELIRGTPNGSIQVVAYSDFQCYFCKLNFEKNITALLKKHEGDIYYVYKHLPLSFHKYAYRAAQYYEAIRIQSADEAVKFHDMLFSNQDKLESQGESILIKLASTLIISTDKLNNDLNSTTVKKRIEEDMLEAQRFGIQGTPTVIINGKKYAGARQYTE